MKKLVYSLSLLLALAFANAAFAQTILTTTTLASAVTSSSTTSIQLTSSIGVTAGATVLYIADASNSGEAVFVNFVGTAGYVGVTRGYQTLGGAVTHANGTVVFIGPPFAFRYNQPRGSCTRANEPYLPAITFGTTSTATVIADCIGGEWVIGSGVNSFSTFAPQYQPDPGGTAYTALNTNGTTLSATTQYCTEIDVRGSKYVTGLAPLLGTTGGTDKHIVALYDATGNLLANSALAGTTAGTASTYEQIPFTSKYYVVGPAKFYACMQTNGTTATVRMLTTSTQDAYTTKSYTVTFGTLPNPIAVPTTFTTAVGPFWQMY